MLIWNELYIVMLPNNEGKSLELPYSITLFCDILAIQPVFFIAARKLVNSSAKGN